MVFDAGILPHFITSQSSEWRPNECGSINLTSVILQDLRFPSAIQFITRLNQPDDCPQRNVSLVKQTQSGPLYFICSHVMRGPTGLRLRSFCVHVFCFCYFTPHQCVPPLWRPAVFSALLTRCQRGQCGFQLPVTDNFGPLTTIVK